MIPGGPVAIAGELEEMVFFDEAGTLKQIVAIVKPFVVERVVAAIVEHRIDNVQIRTVKGFGRQKNYLDRYGESEYSRAFLPKVEINIWADDEDVDGIIREIVEVARTGRLGDGKIIVLPVLRAINIAANED